MKGEAVMEMIGVVVVVPVANLVEPVAAAGQPQVVAVALQPGVVQKAAAMEGAVPRTKANLLQRSEHNSKQSDQQGVRPC